MVKDSWQRKALTEASAAKAREASGRERGGHVFWEEKYRDGRNVGKEQPGGEIHDGVGEKIPRGWKSEGKAA